MRISEKALISTFPDEFNLTPGRQEFPDLDRGKNPSTHSNNLIIDVL